MRIGALTTRARMLPVLAFAVGGAAFGVLLGALTAGHTAWGLLGSGAVLAAAIAIRSSVWLAVIAVSGTYLCWRVGGGSLAAGTTSGLAISDVLLAVASVAALAALLGSGELRRLRPVAIGLGCYLTALLPTAFLNSSGRGSLEWFHRAFLVGGSLLVGAWLVRAAMVRPALRLFLAVSTALAIFTIVESFRTDFAPVYPLGLHKNFAGALIAVAFLVAAAANSYPRLPAGLQAFVVVILAGGLFATQSRGSMLAAVFGLLIALVLGPGGHRTGVRVLAVLMAIGLSAFTYLSVRDQLRRPQNEVQLGPIGVRFNVEHVTREIWRTSPVDGVGLKYFNSGDFGPFAQAPNNVIDNELAESGVIGLLGFVVLQGTLLVVGVRRRRDNRLVAVGLGAVGGLLLHGQVDVYWIAGSASLPFMIFGMALAEGAGALPGRGRRPPALAAANA